MRLVIDVHEKRLGMKGYEMLVCVDGSEGFSKSWNERDGTNLSNHLHCVQNSMVTRGYRGGDDAVGLSMAAGTKLTKENYAVRVDRRVFCEKDDVKSIQAEYGSW